MSSEGKDTLAEFVKVLKDVRRRLVSVDTLRGAIIYIVWSTIVCGYTVLHALYTGLVKAESVPNTVNFIYWVSAIAIFYFYLFKYIEPSIFKLASRLGRDVEATKKYYKRAMTLITIGWGASFSASFTLIPLITYAMHLSLSGELLASSALLFALGLGNLTMFLILKFYLGTSDYVVLTGSILLLTSGATDYFLSRNYWDFASGAIVLVYNLMGVAYILMSFRTLVRD